MIEISPKYRPLFESDDRYYLIQGGRGSGKSFSLCSWLVLLLMFERGHTVLFTRYTLTSANISIMPEIIEKIDLFGFSDKFSITKDSIICKLTGSSIIFKGIKTSTGDNSAALKSLQGITTFILEEAEELTEEAIFDKIDYSVRTKGMQNRVILVMNPATKANWIYKRYYENTGVVPGSNISKNGTTYISTTYLDNLDNLDKSFLDSVERMKKDNPKKYNHIMLGGWMDTAEGVIFSNWEIGEFNDDLEYGYGCDWGFSNDPSTLTKVAIDKKNKIIYLDEKLYKAGLTTTELYNIMKPECDNKEIIADNSEPRLIDELYSMGLNIDVCVKGAGSVAEGITLMQDYKLIITPGSINIVKELNNYVWSNRKAGMPVDMYNHAIDGIRYYVSHILKEGNGEYFFA